MKNFRGNIILVGVIGIINLVLLYYLKYATNSLSISEFSLFKTGNMISFLLTTLLLIACFLLIVSKRQISFAHIRVISILSLSYLVPLIVLVIFNLEELVFIDSYFLGYPLKKIVPVIFLTFNQIIFLFTLLSIFFLGFGNGMFSYVKSLLLLVTFITLLILTSTVYTFYVEKYRFDEGSNFDYGIILGAAVWSKNKPSPIFSARIDKGAELFTNNKIKRIQVTGGNAPGEISEANAARRQLVEKHSISENYIVIEEITSTTNEQIRYIKKSYGSDEPKKSFLFISDEFHLRRISEMADFYDLNAEVISSEYELNFKKSLYYRMRDSIGLLLFWFFAV